MWGCPRVPTPSSILLSQLPSTEHLPCTWHWARITAINHTQALPGPAHTPPPLTFQMSCPLAWVFPSTPPTPHSLTRHMGTKTQVRTSRVGEDWGSERWLRACPCSSSWISAVLSLLFTAIPDAHSWRSPSGQKGSSWGMQGHLSQPHLSQYWRRWLSAGTQRP